MLERLRLQPATFATARMRHQSSGEDEGRPYSGMMARLQREPGQTHIRRATS